MISLMEFQSKIKMDYNQLKREKFPFYRSMKKILTLLVELILYIGHFRWQVEVCDCGIKNPGFRIFGITFTYYKWADGPIIHIGTPVSEDGPIREAEKRELQIPYESTDQWIGERL